MKTDTGTPATPPSTNWPTKATSNWPTDTTQTIVPSTLNPDAGEGTETDDEGEAKRSVVVSQALMTAIKAPRAGLLIPETYAGQRVKAGQTLARILHPCEGYQLCAVESPADATVFFLRDKSICFQNTLLFRLIGEDCDG